MEGLHRASEHFERAIVADPEYALPHAGIADVYAVMGNRDFMPTRNAFSKALASATRALELAPNLAEAHASLGAIAEVYHWDWSEAGRKYRRAIELSPSYATAHQWYALHCARLLGPGEPHVEGARALTLRRDPRVDRAMTVDLRYPTGAVGRVHTSMWSSTLLRIRARVVGHIKGDKLVVFKKKRRKGYRVKNGHRQQFTKIAIDGISFNQNNK
jgi:tetratricopeptide (TPR) repeat protein